MLQSNSHIIIKPWITEKAAGMAKDRQYVFMVSKRRQFQADQGRAEEDL